MSGKGNYLTIEVLKYLKFKKISQVNCELSFIAIIVKYIKEVRKLPFVGKFKTGQYLALGNTINQHRALDAICSIDSKISHYTFSRIIKKPKFPIGLYMLVFGFIILVRLWWNNSSVLKNYKVEHATSLLMIIASYKVAKKIFAKTGVVSLWLSNDHSPIHLGLLAGARKLGIKTYYLQHAHVTSRFPRLTFDFAFLDGCVAERLYRKSQNTHVRLIGPIRYAGYIKGKMRNTTIDILIGVNLLDDLQLVRSYIDSIKKTHPNIIIAIKPHPRLNNRALSKIFNFSETKFIFRSESNILDALSCSRIFVAGNTSAHLEAVLQSNVSVYKNFGNEVFDYYGFVKEGLSSVEEVSTIIKNEEKYNEILSNQSKILTNYFANIENIQKNKLRHLALYV